MVTTELERAFRALASRRRLDIIELLTRRGALQMNEVAAGIHLSVKSTNKHLQQLLHAGFLDKARRGLPVYYRLAEERSPLVAKLMRLVAR